MTTALAINSGLREEKKAMINEMARGSKEDRRKNWSRLLDLEEADNSLVLSSWELKKILGSCIETVIEDCDRGLLFAIMYRMNPELQKADLLGRFYNFADFLYYLFLGGMQKQ